MSLKSIFSENDYELLRNSIAKLSKLERKIITLRFWEAQTIEEISNTLGMQWDEVDRRIEGIQAKLRRLFLDGKVPKFPHTQNLKTAA